MEYKKKQIANDLYAALKGTRGKSLTLREASKKIGVSIATLSRVQNEGTPDIITYARVCKFLGASMEKYIK